MVKVAIAGGTRGVGRSIIDALRADEEYEAIILTRKVYKPGIHILTSSS